MPNSPVRRVQLFATCLVDHFCPQVAMSVVEVLERIGIEVHVPDGQTCCGQPAFNAGMAGEARMMAKHTIDVFRRSPDPIVVPSGSCAEMIRHHYAELFDGDREYGAAAADLAARTYEFAEFLVDVVGRVDLGASAEGDVAVYHPSCHGLRGLGLKRQAVELMRHVEGLEHRALADDETCCGFGGVFAVTMGDISSAMMARKIESIEASGARTVVATDVSCLMHLAGGLRRRGSAVRTCHLAEILAPNRVDR